MSRPSQAFTTMGAGIARVLSNQCEVSEAYNPSIASLDVDISGTPAPKRTAFKTIWDTGATNSVITQAIVTACNLKPTSMVNVHGVHGQSLAPVFFVNIVLPGNMLCRGVRVTLGQMQGGDLLIGMDIISRGDFVVTNHNGKTMFSFRTPSIGHIDFVKQINVKQSIAVKSTPPRFTRGHKPKKKR